MVNTGLSSEGNNFIPELVVISSLNSILFEKIISPQESHVVMLGGVTLQLIRMSTFKVNTAICPRLPFLPIKGHPLWSGPYQSIKSISSGWGA